MKITIQTICLALLSLLFAQISAFGQLYEVSLDEKIEQSTLIVEGKVIESQCYRADNGDIYTANKVELVSILKGDYREKFLTITTWGGEIGSEAQTWSHLLMLDKGDYGIFCLEPTHVPAIDDSNFPGSFDVYAGVQGFIRLVQNEAKAWVAYEPFHTYADIDADLYGYIARKTGKKLSYVDGGGDVKRSGVRYHFTNIALSGSTITFKVYVNSLEGTKSLYCSGLQFTYNPTFFGSNIATNGNLTMQSAGISLSSAYSLSQSNVTSSKVKIELVPTGTTFSGLNTIGTTEQLLANGSITIQNILADPGITYDIAEMQSMSKFYVGGTAQVFDTVVVDGDWRIFEQFAPSIDSISPTSLRAGVGDVLTIYGSGFTSSQPSNGRVQFRSAFAGDIGTWIEALPFDYKEWTATKIKVIVPSVAYFNFDNTATSENYAGTGSVRVKIGGSTSNKKDLNVRFCARNDAQTSIVTNKDYRVVEKLRNFNTQGGYDLYFTPDFSNLSGAEDAFKRALTTWRCQTKVNFTPKKFADIPTNLQQYACAIKLGALPAGCPASAKACSFLDISSGCGADSLIVLFYNRFEITFKSGGGISWHTGTNQPVLNWSNEIDLETAALHEIGHAHLLQHSNNANDVMYFESTKYKRTLEPNDLEGGLYIMSISTLNDGCSVKMLPITGECDVPVPEVQNLRVIGVSPNPFNDEIRIKVDSDAVFEKLKVEIFNTVGQSIKCSYQFSDQEIIINTRNIREGVYFLGLSNKGGLAKFFELYKFN